MEPAYVYIFKGQALQVETRLLYIPSFFLTFIVHFISIQ